MANFKRKKPKNCRAGCLMCKPHKQNGFSFTKKYKKIAHYFQSEEKDARKEGII